MLNTGNIYLNKILGITLCWALWKKLFTQNTGDYFMLNTVGRFIYTKYWGLLLVEHCENIYLHKIFGNTLCWTLGKFIYTKYWGIMYVLALWEDLSTQNIEEYCMLNTVGRFIYTKYWGNCMLNTVGIFIHTKYWGILYVEHCGKIYLQKKYWGILYVEHRGNIYLHKLLRNTLCWAL